MSAERAIEILRSTSWGEYMRHMSQPEIEHVNAVWATLPGSASFYTALCNIAYPNRGQHS